jgi:hypothetical protein
MRPGNAMETYTVRIITFFSLMFIVEIVVVLWAGVGWFLLIETIRRACVALPWTYIPLLRFLRGEDRANEELKYLTTKKFQWRYVLRLTNLIVWAILTFITFEKANYALIDILR